MKRRNVSIAFAGLVLLFALALSLNSQAGAMPIQTSSSPQAAITIPRATTAKVDARCSDYADGVTYTYPDASVGPTLAGKVHMKHDGTTLFVCMEATPGTFKDRFGSLYLDPQGDAATGDFAQTNDFALRTSIISNTHTSLHGTGVSNGYVVDSSVDALWQGAALPQLPAGSQYETIEWGVSMGRFKLAECGAAFGLAAYHQWVNAVGDDYGWPSNHFFDQPATWQSVLLGGPNCLATPTATATVAPTSTPIPQASGRIAYVYRGNTLDATSYRNLLVSRGYTVQLVPLNTVLATNFSAFDLILIADDTGNLDQWGLTGLTSLQVAHIVAGHKPITGLGEGGYAFFGQLSLFIGWAHGWHGPESIVNKASTPPANSIYGGPTPIVVDPVPVYAAPVNAVGIYLGGGSLPADVFPIGLENPTKDHASIIMQGCRQLWGFSGNPLQMTGTGKELFLNAVHYNRFFQCAADPVPPTSECVRISKSSVPPSGTTVHPGDVIAYTITYLFSNNPNCNNRKARLTDTVPQDTIFIPGSATGGIAPTVDGELSWSVLPAATTATKNFKVVVSETQCRNQRRVNNRAGLLVDGRPPVISNVVSHPVQCPDVGFDNPNTPPYAESEIQINPYPLITGQASQISVKIRNDSSVTQNLTVDFMTSPNRFGIGLDFSSFDTKHVVVPAHGNVIVLSSFTPVSSGHYCIQVRVQGPGLAPIYTAHNIDVTEDLKPGVPDVLSFKVRNPKAVTANMELQVDNTCPGWTATVSPVVLLGMAPGEVRTAQLTVTPPNPATLGTACHIDVQGFIGTELIGGIRKLDVPPVHLPQNVQPSWLEPEISAIPDPPVVGQLGQLCVQLQNPMSLARTVSVDFQVADFGAGIPFTTVASQNYTLPGFSIANYCAPWTPAAGGTLHRCVQVILHQANQQDERSQHNFDVVRIRAFDPSQIRVPVRIGNPDGVTHTLRLDPVLWGIDPGRWRVRWLPDPPPDLQPNEVINLTLALEAVPAAEATNVFAPAASPSPDDFFGDVSRIDVREQLDGQTVGGFSVGVDTVDTRIFLPFIQR